MPDTTLESIAALDKKMDTAVEKAKAAETTAAGATEKIKALETLFEGLKTDNAAELKKTADEAQKAVDYVKDFLAKEGRKGNADQVIKSLGGLVFDLVGKSQETIDSLYKGAAKTIALPFDTKAVNDMTLGTNLTGNGVITYRPTMVELPMWPVHLRDLVAVTPSATDTYHFYQQNLGQGAIDWQSAEGATKPQIDEHYTEASVTCKYLAGFLVISRQMLRNLPALQANLSRWLPEQYYRAEDAKGYAALSGASDLTPGDTTGTNTVNRLLNTVGTLEAAGFIVTGYAVNPVDWAKLMQTASTGSTAGIYSLPGSVVLAPDGTLNICGVPIRKANWVPAGTIIAGDWRYFEIIQSEALSMRMFEEDGTNARQNKITVRIEASIGFAVLQPAAFALVATV